MGNDLKLVLGGTYEDKISSFTGIATIATLYHNGCEQYVLEPTKLSSDGEPIKAAAFDFQQLQRVGKSVIDAGEIVRPRINMEAVVRDKISGFEGVVVAISTLLAGKPEIAVQPQKVKPDGSPIKAVFFSEGRLEVIKDSKPEKPEKRPGGPPGIIPAGASGRDR